MAIEGGLFFSLLGLAFFFIAVNVKFKEYFYFIPVIIFLILGMWLLMGEDIMLTSSSTDGTTTVNSTTYIIGDASTDYNVNGPWMGLALILASFVLTFLAFLGLTKDKQQV